MATRALPTAQATDLLHDLALRDALFTRSPAAVAVFDTDLRYIAANGALLAIKGTTEAELLGHRVTEVLPGIDGVAIEAALREVLRTGQTIHRMRVRGPTRRQPDGQRDFDVTYYRLDAPDGTVLGVGCTVDDVSERVAAQAAAAIAEQRLTLLEEASARFAASLDLGRLADEIVDIAVPRFADHLVVDVDAHLFRPGDEEPLAEPARGGGAPSLLRRLAVGHAGPLGVTGCPWPGVGAILDHAGSVAATTALATGQAVLEPDVHAAAAAGRLDPDVAAWARCAGLRSAIVAPMVVRDRVIGLLTAFTSHSGRSYDSDDSALAAVLAARAGLALDNARLYARERSAAVMLQRSLLPRVLPSPAGVEVASRYLPGAAGTEVGGDWFDVVSLPGGRVGVVVGDVMGRGLQAAAAMGQVRIAVRTLAGLDLAPGVLLAHLDRLAHHLDQVQLATCSYAVYDPATRVLSLASAGHLPPVVASPGRPARLVELPCGAPLGVGGLDFQTATVLLEDDAVILLYTDGLVESRSRSLQEGLDALVTAMTAPPRCLEAACDRVLSAMGRDGAHDDDVAMLLLRVSGLPAPAAGSGPVPHSA